MKLQTSPYYILVFLYRRGFIILTLPLQAFLLQNLNPYIAAYVYITDSFLIFALILSGCLSYKNLKLTLTSKNLLFENGVITKSRTLLPKDKITYFSTAQSPIQKLLRICKVTVVSSKKQLTLYLSKKRLPHFVCNFTSYKDKARLIFKNGFIPTFFLSAGFYNAFTGALTIVPVLNKISTLTASANPQRYPLINLQTIPTCKNLNLILSTATTAIIGLWGLGVLITFFRYQGLSVYKNGSFIETRRGIFVKRHARANANSISAVVLRQNILMSGIRRYTGELRISCENKENKLTFICSESHNRCLSIISLLLNNFNPPKSKKLRPHKKALLAYTFLPLLSLITFSVFSVAADIYSLYVSKTRFSLFVTLWLCVWLIFRIMVFKRCFIASDNKTLLICTYSGMTFCKAYIPTNKIISVKLTTSIFQKRLGTCSLHIQVKNRRPLTFKIKHIDNKKTAELVKKLCG